MGNEFCIVLTTTNNEAVKQHLVDIILSNKLAACIQTMPIESHYVWEGTVCDDKEILLSIKTQTKHYKKLVDLIEEHHDYDVPQIIQVPIVKGFEPYLSWIKNTATC